MAPEAMLHAAAGVTGMLSGATALSVVKGSPLHKRAGTVFVIAMGATAASGAYLGVITQEFGNIIAGVLTLYVLITAWMTVRRPEGEVGKFEIGAFAFATIGALVATYGAAVALQDPEALLGGIPAIVFAVVITLMAGADLSVLIRGGLRGRQRVARHLWRMMLGFAAAVGSFFPGQLPIFPEWIQEVRPIIVLFIPFFGVIGLMLFWLAYVLATKTFASNPSAAQT
nr:hypothetical protein [Nitrosomonas nitrosa]